MKVYVQKENESVYNDGLYMNDRPRQKGGIPEALKKGKAAAEKLAVGRLPRLVISSDKLLPRFAPKGVALPCKL